LISLRLPELSIVAKGRTNDATPSAVALLTRRLSAGEDEAFRQFQTIYFGRLYRFLLVVARGDETQAREALQETFVRVARHVRKFEDEEAFWNWVKVIGRNAARDAGRKQRRYAFLLERFTRSSQNEGPSTGPEDSLASALVESFGELASDERLLIQGKYMDGASVKELAVQSGLTVKAVESRLLRLRQQLRQRTLKKFRMP
jgi:RNA polymerase sigma-70 factor (ECF subfamily)